MASSEPPQKKARTVESGNDESIQDVDEKIKGTIKEINFCQAEIEKLNEKASEEILEIEQKYNRLRKPYFRQRNELFKKLPSFWGKTFTNHPLVSTIIQEEEKDCLSYITDCIAEEFDDIKLGYEISFQFGDNPYLENTVITKTMHLASSEKARSETTPIKWKEGKDLLAKYKVKIGSNVKRRRQPPATFFSWLVDNSDGSTDEVAETIKEDLWPSALQYYLSQPPENGKYEYGNDSGDSEVEEDGEEEVLDSEYSGSDLEDGAEKEVLVNMVEDSIAEAELEGQYDSQEYSEGSDIEGNELLNDDNSEVAQADSTKSVEKKTEDVASEGDKEDDGNT